MKRRPWTPLCVPGMLVGALFFAASLTPSLVPRTYLTQGLISGLSLAIGYAAGAFVQWLWIYLKVPNPRRQLGRVVLLAAIAIGAGIAAFALGKAAEWQNSVRKLMELPPVDMLYSLGAALVALVVFAALLALARLFRLAFRIAAAAVRRFLPRRIANVVGILAAAAIFWTIISGVLIETTLRLMNAGYAARDNLIEPEFPQPTDPLKVGSAASLMTWSKLGRRGREFIVSGPTRTEISAFLNRDAVEPVRVYAGLWSADTARARAKLALEELKRVGGFERSALVVVTPTGTGWIDAAALDSVEYLHGGDIASVAVQYSYVGSWLNHVSGSEYGFDTARVLFEEVYAYWTRLPKDHRPKLYLYGLSLGAKSSTESTDLTEVLGDPVNGALWAGPPYSTRLWRFFTERRDPQSPVWLPRFRDGSFVRFMNQDGDAARQAAVRNADWGPMRVVFLQYASDATTFFDYSTIYREPEWMRKPRGPDVSPEVRWYPVVSFLQLLVDMPMAMFAPVGHGHVYSAPDYIGAWVEVADIEGWSPGEIARLNDHLLPQSGAIGSAPRSY